MKLFFLLVLSLITLAANADYHKTHLVSNGVIAVECDDATGTMIRLKALVDIPEGTEMPMSGACEIRA